MAMPIGPLRNFGDISVTKTAMPTATGIATIRERKVVMRVPYILVSAPKDSFTGSQSVEVRNFMTPNFPIASEDSEISTYKIPMINIMTENEAMAVTDANIVSTGFLLAVLGI